MTSPTGTASPEVLSLQELLRVLRHQWLVIVTFVALAVLTAASYTHFFLSPCYQATTTIRVERAEGQISLFQPTGRSVDRVFLNDQIAILQSAQLWHPVIEELDLERRIPAGLERSEWTVATTYRYVLNEMLEVRENPSSSILNVVGRPAVKLSAAKALTSLHGRKLRELLDPLRGSFDVIFLDSPPILGISDAAVLARMADGVVAVIQRGRNPQAMTRRAVHILRQVEANLVGCILNNVLAMNGEDYICYTQNDPSYASENSPRQARPNGQIRPDRITLTDRA